MKTVFADAFYYLALLNANDSAHSRAVELAKTARHRILTTA